MYNIKLTLQYDGTRYLGWSRPEKDSYEKTIAFRISSVLERMTGKPVSLYAGAKTEPKVHALCQTVNFYTDSPLSPEQFFCGLNQYLPRDIAVQNCESAPERFRADLNAVSRTYEYRICTAPVYDIFTAGYSAHLFPCPDIEAMRKAAAPLIGKHDFRAFSGARAKKGTCKEIFDISFSRSGTEPDLLIISLTANDFLYQMPSRIVSMLLEAGKNGSVRETDKKAGSLCDPRGLLLRSVQYKKQTF